MTPLTIQRMGRFIRIGGALFIAVLIAIYGITWLWPELVAAQHPPLHVAGISANLLASLALGDRLLVAAVSLPYLAALVWAFVRLDRMLRAFEAGAFFESATVGHLRAFAGYLLLAKALAMAAMHVRVWLLTLLLGPQRVQVHINLADDVSMLLMCALFFLIARMMEEGRRIADENRGFV